MLIEYKGGKPSKTLTFNHKDWGLQSVVWDEFNGKVAEVTDQEFLRFLLHPDRKGLFARVEKIEGGKEVKKADDVKASDASQPLAVDPVTPTPVVVKSKPGPKKKVTDGSNPS